MKLSVDKHAAELYIREMGLAAGDALRIFVRLGGCGSVQPGLSLGIMKEVPRDPGIEQVVEGVRFYMEKDNLWYLDNRDLYVRYDGSEDDVYFDVQ
ncbi:hypothetical protein DNH61_04745 [Paenibacillus sambharensis]|uniref:FeS cluster biogenesis domain-containing protein n=1 Tax=Paenibacillus sambharensis TaxID=1803190 RepID=A0A2W1LQB3_9BACL|nr:HesB/YadR/YfhF family protein [Paenibacillus sambharensis]PZD97035.1 hypothetical protein DNH61_04745 [Paenibacillus sambharensis]